MQSFREFYFCLLAPLVGFTWNMLPLTLVMLTLVAFSLTGLGYIIAWRMDSTQGFHAIMNVLLIPMWLLSGAVFPAKNASFWLKAVIMVNPLTYGLAAVRWCMYGSDCRSDAWICRRLPCRWPLPSHSA